MGREVEGHPIIEDFLSAALSDNLLIVIEWAYRAVPSSPQIGSNQPAWRPIALLNPRRDPCPSFSVPLLRAADWGATTGTAPSSGPSNFDVLGMEAALREFATGVELTGAVCTAAGAASGATAAVGSLLRSGTAVSPLRQGEVLAGSLSLVRGPSENSLPLPFSLAPPRATALSEVPPLPWQMQPQLPTACEPAPPLTLSGFAVRSPPISADLLGSPPPFLDLGRISRPAAAGARPRAAAHGRRRLAAADGRRADAAVDGGRHGGRRGGRHGHGGPASEKRPPPWACATACATACARHCLRAPLPAHATACARAGLEASFLCLQALVERTPTDTQANGLLTNLPSSGAEVSVTDLLGSLGTEELLAQLLKSQKKHGTLSLVGGSDEKPEVSSTPMPSPSVRRTARRPAAPLPRVASPPSATAERGVPCAQFAQFDLREEMLAAMREEMQSVHKELHDLKQGVMEGCGHVTTNLHQFGASLTESFDKVSTQASGARTRLVSSSLLRLLLRPPRARALSLHAHPLLRTLAGVGEREEPRRGRRARDQRARRGARDDRQADGRGARTRSKLSRRSRRSPAPAPTATATASTFATPSHTRRCFLRDADHADREPAHHGRVRERGQRGEPAHHGRGHEAHRDRRVVRQDHHAGERGRRQPAHGAARCAAGAGTSRTADPPASLPLSAAVSPPPNRRRRTSTRSPATTWRRSTAWPAAPRHAPPLKLGTAAGPQPLAPTLAALRSQVANTPAVEALEPMPAAQPMPLAPVPEHEVAAPPTPTPSSSSTPRRSAPALEPLAGAAPQNASVGFLHAECTLLPHPPCPVPRHRRGFMAPTVASSQRKRSAPTPASAPAPVSAPASSAKQRRHAPSPLGVCGTPNANRM